MVSIDMTSERFVLVFDFETTGLPKNSWVDYELEPVYKNGMMFGKSEEKDYPYAIQLSYILYDNVTNKAKVVNEMIRLPDGIDITESSYLIHKISLDMTQGKTRKIKSRKTRRYRYDYNYTIDKVLQKFMTDFQKADVVVSHNVQFDKNMILVEMDRLRKIPHDKYIIFNDYIQEIYYSKKFYCTALNGKSVWKNIGTNCKGIAYYKIPKLSILYQTLFGVLPNEEKLHDALYDVVICIRCFYMMRYNIDIIDYNRKIKELI
jgi:DNA polymerase III epsilon subunit-like protein